MSGDGGFARSSQSVSNQKLQRAVEADVRQRGIFRALQQRWTKTQEAKIGAVRAGAAQAAKSGLVAEQRVEVDRQIAWKRRHLRFAVENLGAGDFALRRRAQDGRQLVAAALNLGL